MSKASSHEDEIDVSESIRNAFSDVRYMDDDDEIKLFAWQWGGLDIPAFLQAFHKGPEIDHMIAIFALGFLEAPEARELLLPLLKSANPFERWACAISFGESHVEEVIDVLVQILTEVPVIDEDATELHVGLFDYWRIRVIYILSKLERPTFAPVFREGLRTVWSLANNPAHDTAEVSSCLDSLTYALGKIDAFGALTGLPLSEKGFSVAMVHLACGYLHSHLRYGKAINPGRVMDGLHENADFRAEIEAVLLLKFGVTKTDCDQILANFYHYSIDRFSDYKSEGAMYMFGL